MQKHKKYQKTIHCNTPKVNNPTLIGKKDRKEEESTKNSKT
jgi:hypothetical protein